MGGNWCERESNIVRFYVSSRNLERDHLKIQEDLEGTWGLLSLLASEKQDWVSPFS